MRVPFQLKLKPMVCFKKWVKTTGEPSGHLTVLPKLIEILDPTAVITGYGTEEEDSGPTAEELEAAAAAAAAKEAEAEAARTAPE